jgi:hypothetical protein
MRKATLILLNAGRVLMDVLREIFDESAYARFLERKKASASPQSYAAFSRERDAAQERRQRCC